MSNPANDPLPRLPRFADRLGLEGEERRKFLDIQWSLFQETSRLRLRMGEVHPDPRRAGPPAGGRVARRVGADLWRLGAGPGEQRPLHPGAVGTGEGAGVPEAGRQAARARPRVRGGFRWARSTRPAPPGPVPAETARPSAAVRGGRSAGGITLLR